MKRLAFWVLVSLNILFVAWIFRGISSVWSYSSQKLSLTLGLLIFYGVIQVFFFGGKSIFATTLIDKWVCYLCLLVPLFFIVLFLGLVFLGGSSFLNP